MSTVGGEGDLGEEPVEPVGAQVSVVGVVQLLSW